MTGSFSTRAERVAVRRKRANAHHTGGRDRTLRWRRLGATETHARWLCACFAHDTKGPLAIALVERQRALVIVVVVELVVQRTRLSRTVLALTEPALVHLIDVGAPGAPWARTRLQIRCQFQEEKDKSCEKKKKNE